MIGGALLPYGALAELSAGRDPAPASRARRAGRRTAASFTVAYQTGWMALVHRARLQPGETVLVHAAAGGVGTAAIAVAKAIGARVVGVVGGADKAAVASRLGADAVIDRLEHTAFDGLVGCAEGGPRAGRRRRGVRPGRRRQFPRLDEGDGVRGPAAGDRFRGRRRFRRWRSTTRW